jgi:transcription elongation GreA/GreB family factor
MSTEREPYSQNATALNSQLLKHFQNRFSVTTDKSMPIIQIAIPVQIKSVNSIQRHTKPVKSPAINKDALLPKKLKEQMLQAMQLSRTSSHKGIKKAYKTEVYKSPKETCISQTYSVTKTIKENKKNEMKFVQEFANKHNSISKMMVNILKQLKENKEYEALKQKVTFIKSRSKRSSVAKLLPPLESHETSVTIPSAVISVEPAKTRKKTLLYKNVLNPAVIPSSNAIEELHLDKKKLSQQVIKVLYSE